MKTRIAPLFGLLAIALVLGLAADAPAKAAATDSSTVVFENDKANCILYQTGSGKNVCGFGMRSYPTHLSIMKTAGTFRVTTPDSKEATEEAKAGDVGWEPAVTHRYEAISPGTVEVYLIEVKDKDWKPSTDLKP